MSSALRLVRSALLLVSAGLQMSAGAMAADSTQAPLLQRSLFADRRAHSAGDVLTVVITETASATATARTRADKQESVAANFGETDHKAWNLDLGWGNDFQGGGQIQRTGRLLGKLAVVVQAVDADGNLVILGEQDINVNNEKQRIALSGRVRPDDISPDNTVPSWRIVQAKIDFKGDGILARKQSPGLMTWLFDLFGLN